ncbi:predicted protein [Sclerotinia sclerotiorum 1980 UF-70]|uniref:Uncharacterized protein n=1 Tax=Sclerotinia sclerotiorum (strain ATCC 18683 / 1980 / Ss-1) TaxID=665079 RepID=A7E8P3_SCLS1|nr:predicted protein [Sclerotinia sclerotiorum 1980 UF-70]EDN96745.1 predicted protein [Sclerotinia sclerotiorum 1980 UF-70]
MGCNHPLGERLQGMIPAELNSKNKKQKALERRQLRKEPTTGNSSEYRKIRKIRKKAEITDTDAAERYLGTFYSVETTITTMTTLATIQFYAQWMNKLVFQVVVKAPKENRVDQ